jgi:hypothetical protein
LKYRTKWTTLPLNPHINSIMFTLDEDGDIIRETWFSNGTDSTVIFDYELEEVEIISLQGCSLQTIYKILELIEIRKDELGWNKNKIIQ